MSRVPSGGGTSAARTSSEGEGDVRLLFGTTSYVLPADLLPNVRLLASLVEDIELILFEGEYSNLPSRSDIAELGRLADEGGCGFTVHLPLDVGIGELDRAVRLRAQDTCLRVIDLTGELVPHAFVVHPELPLSYHPPLGEKPEPLTELPHDLHERWQEALGESFARLSAEAGPRPLAVENLQYPFGWLRPLLDRFDLGVTMDVGHLLLHGGTVERHLADFGDRLTVVHLHGIVDGHDHREIGAFAPGELVALFDAVSRVPTAVPVADARGHGDLPGAVDRTRAVVVSLEVFGWEPTVPSLRTLAAALDGRRPDAARFSDAADAVLAALPAWVPAQD